MCAVHVHEGKSKKVVGLLVIRCILFIVRDTYWVCLQLHMVY